MGDQRRYWRATMVFGLLAIATAVWFLTRPMPACGGAPLTSAMLDFEMATTQPEFAAVIDCAPRRAELDFQNIVDLLLFMWAYVGFLTAATSSRPRSSGRSPRRGRRSTRGWSPCSRSRCA